MVRLLLTAVLYCVSCLALAEGTKEPFDLVVEARDCSERVRVAGRFQLGPGEPELFRSESFARRSLIALELSLPSATAFSVRGNFLTACGNVSIDTTALVGETARVDADGLWVSVTLTRAGS